MHRLRHPISLFALVLLSLVLVLTVFFVARPATILGIPIGLSTSMSTDMPTKGIDVSRHQHDVSGAIVPIDWCEVWNNGYSFTYIKATEGDSNPPQVKNEFLVPDVAAAETDNCKLFVGVYHLGRPDLHPDAVNEAEFFVSVAKDYLKPGYMQPALDIEDGYANKVSTDALNVWVDTWMKTVTNETKSEALPNGVQAILYVGKSTAKRMYPYISKYKLWIADSNHPDGSGSPDISDTPWKTWTFWQYKPNSPKGSVPGIQTTVDLDIFNSAQFDWRESLIPSN